MCVRVMMIDLKTDKTTNIRTVAFVARSVTPFRRAPYPQGLISSGLCLY